MQGFSLLDLFPAGLRAAKNPKRRRRRRKRTRKRRNTRKRRRRTRRSIPRRMLPHHPRILPRIGIRGSWAGLGPQQCRTGGRIQDSPVVTAGSSAGISWLSKIPFPPQNHLTGVPSIPAVPAGTTAGKRRSARRRRGTAGGGTARTPARDPRAAAASAAPPGGAAGAGTAAAATRPRGGGAGRGAGPAPPRPAGSGSATTPTRRTESEPGAVSGTFCRDLYFLSD